MSATDEGSALLLTWVALRAEYRTSSTGFPQDIQLRILGDERRGYLVAGLLGIPHGDQFDYWFETRREAMEFAGTLGIPTEAWRAIMDAGEVRPRREMH